MTTENTQQAADKMEDLTVSETETANVNGGMAAVDYYLQIDGVQGESKDRHTK
jgi:hypothetical protein